MYNSFIFKKHSQQIERQQIYKRKGSKWNQNYKSKVRPALIQKYSRRINNFITRIEEDKKDFYQYRQESQSKAHQLLKEIYRKEKYLGDSAVKLRDISDWASMLSPTQRIQKEKNKKAFQHKFGESNIAYRSIASQSAYRSPDASQFRQREKVKEVHKHNMRFTSKTQSFSENKKEKELIKGRTITQPSPNRNHTSQVFKDINIRKSTSSNNQYLDDDARSHAFSVFSTTPDHLPKMSDEDSSISNHRQNQFKATRQGNSKNKVYFKQLVDLQQNSRDHTVKKSLHQILVRFGMSRIKDLKKQAMVETDNLCQDQF